MTLIKFKRYKDYIEAQERTIKRRGFGPYYTQDEMDAICKWIKDRGLTPKRAICHGARNGRESDDLANRIPGLKAIGTDLFPFSGKSAAYTPQSKVIKWDFSRPRKQWKHKFDIVYSNSFDHSRNPELTLNTWLEQLAPHGRLFIQYVINSVYRARQGDCYKPTLDELLESINAVRRIEDLLYVNIWDTSPKRKRASHVVVIVLSADEQYRVVKAAKRLRVLPI